MKLSSKVEKSKEKLTFFIDSVFDLDIEEIKRLVPDNAESIEIECKPARRRSGHCLQVDYLINLNVERFER